MQFWEWYMQFCMQISNGRQQSASESVYFLAFRVPSVTIHECVTLNHGFDEMFHFCNNVLRFQILPCLTLHIHHCSQIWLFWFHCFKLPWCCTQWVRTCVLLPSVLVTGLPWGHFVLFATWTPQYSRICWIFQTCAVVLQCFFANFLHLCCPFLFFSCSWELFCLMCLLCIIHLPYKQQILSRYYQYLLTVVSHIKRCRISQITN